MPNQLLEQLQETRMAEVPGVPETVFDELYVAFDEICQLPDEVRQALSYQRPRPDSSLGMYRAGYSSVEPFTHEQHPDSKIRIAGRRAFDYVPALGRQWMQLATPRAVKDFLGICDAITEQSHTVMKSTLCELDEGTGDALMPAYPDGVTAPYSRLRIAQYNSSQIEFGTVDDPHSPQLIVPHHDRGYAVLALNATHPGFYGGTREPERVVHLLEPAPDNALFFVGREWQQCPTTPAIEPLYHGAVKTTQDADRARNVAILFTDINE